MKENSIEETIKQLKLMLKVRKQQKEIIECAGGSCINCNPDIKALTESIDILSEYKRTLEENEDLKREIKRQKDINTIINKKRADKNCEKALEKTMTKFLNDNITNESISKQKIKDKIKELSKIKGDFATYIATSERIKALSELLESEE